MEIKQISKVQENLTKVMVQGLVSVLVDAGFNEETAVEMMVEMERRMTTAMHWLPMTPDAVFEDGAEYVVYDRAAELYVITRYVEATDRFLRGGMITHYARITEPK